MYHIVASDLDGTLLSPDHRLTSYTKETLNLLTARGIHFVFATGRHHIDVSQMRNNMEIDAFMITSNGAQVYDPAGQLVFSHDVDEGIARQLFGLRFDDPQIMTNVYHHDQWYMARHNAAENEYFQESVFHYKLFDPATLSVRGVSKVFFTSHDTRYLLPLEQEILSRWGDSLSVCFSSPKCLEVMAARVSKGQALDAVSQLLGYSLSECIAFGDGLNDKEMLTMAGKGCIMRDAHPGLKIAVPQAEVIGSNADDAVPHYLRELFHV